PLLDLRVVTPDHLRQLDRCRTAERADRRDRGEVAQAHGALRASSRTLHLCGALPSGRGLLAPPASRDPSPTGWGLLAPPASRDPSPTGWGLLAPPASRDPPEVMPDATLMRPALARPSASAARPSRRPPSAGRARGRAGRP